MVWSLAGDEHGCKVPPRRKGDRLKEAIAFGERVRELRTERGWSQERLAEAAELNVIQLSNIERGANEPKLTTILRLAKALGIYPGELFRQSRSP
jgi:transcriptional regulator with XRE-family HTH domain